MVALCETRTFSVEKYPHISERSTKPKSALCFFIKKNTGGKGFRRVKRFDRKMLFLRQSRRWYRLVSPSEVTNNLTIISILSQNIRIFESVLLH